MRKKLPFLPKGGRVWQLPPFPHWKRRWWVLSASSVDASPSLTKPLRFGVLLLRSTPFPDGNSRSLMSQLLPDCNTSFQKSTCMGGTVSGIHQCCLFRERCSLPSHQSVAGLSSTPFFDGDILSWGYSSACRQTHMPWAATASASVPCAPFQVWWQLSWDSIV